MGVSDLPVHRTPGAIAEILLHLVERQKPVGKRVVWHGAQWYIVSHYDSLWNHDAKRNHCQGSWSFSLRSDVPVPIHSAEHFGAFLRTIRDVDLRMSTRDLSAALERVGVHVSQPSIVRYERGEREVPFQYLVGLTRLLGRPLCYPGTGNHDDFLIDTSFAAKYAGNTRDPPPHQRTALSVSAFDTLSRFATRISHGFMPATSASQLRC